MNIDKTIKDRKTEFIPSVVFFTAKHSDSPDDVGEKYRTGTVRRCGPRNIGKNELNALFVTIYGF